MAFARAKNGTLRLYSEGREYLLDGGFQQIPDALAAEIAPHVNVEIASHAPNAQEPVEEKRSMRKGEKTQE
jgi:hypothetical protein